MERPNSPMWAPWRMEYLLAEKQKGVCIFCDFLAQDDHFRENLVLFSNAAYGVMLNRFPFTAGHLMVIPRRHVAKITELTIEENSLLFEGVRWVSERLKVAVNPQGLNIGINEGEAAGAGIEDHLHVHVVPRWRGDTNFFPVIADVRVMPEYLDDSYQRLAPAFKNQ